MSKKSSFTKQFNRIMLGSGTALVSLAVAQLAHAAPVGGVVAAGGAAITTPGAGDVTITQTTPNAVINWDRFDVNVGETTRFVQPSASSATLNRVTGSVDPSRILGNVQANGRIALVNPNGVVFGAGSRVDVAGLIATSADISDDQFMNGNYNFTKNGDKDAMIRTMAGAEITAADGALVALVAPNIRHEGVIVANKGTVLLGGGERVTLDFFGDNLVSFAVNGESAGNNAVDVLPAGVIRGDAARVVITANEAASVVNHVVNMRGVVEAHSLDTRGGNVILRAPGATQRVSGTIDVSGKTANANGGTISLDGGTSKLISGSSLKADGKNGGSVELRGRQHIITSGAISAKANGGDNGIVTFIAPNLSVNDGGAIDSFNHVSEIQLEGLLQDGTDVNLLGDRFVHVDDLSDNRLRGGNGNLLMAASVVDGSVHFADANDTLTSKAGEVKLRSGSGGIRAGNFRVDNSTGQAGDVRMFAHNGGDINAGSIYVTGGEGESFVSLKALGGGNINVQNIKNVVSENTASTADRVAFAYLEATDITIADNVTVDATNNAGKAVGYVHMIAEDDATIGGKLSAKGTGADARGRILVEAKGDVDIFHTHARADGSKAAQGSVTINADTFTTREDVDAYGLAIAGSTPATLAGNVTINAKNVIADMNKADASIDFRATDNVVINGDVAARSDKDALIGSAPRLTPKSYQALRFWGGNSVAISGDVNSILTNVDGIAGAGGFTVGAITTGQDISGLTSTDNTGSFVPGTIAIRSTNGGNITTGLLAVTGNDQIASIQVDADGSASIAGVDVLMRDDVRPGSIDGVDVRINAKQDVSVTNDIVIEALDIQGNVRSVPVSLQVLAGRDATIAGNVMIDAEGGILPADPRDANFTSINATFDAGRNLNVGNIRATSTGGTTASTYIDLRGGETIALGDVLAQANNTRFLSGGTEGNTAAAFSDATIRIRTAGTDVDSDANITYKGVNPRSEAEDTSRQGRYSDVQQNANARAELIIIKQPVTPPGGGGIGGGGGGGGGLPTPPAPPAGGGLPIIPPVTPAPPVVVTPAPLAPIVTSATQQPAVNANQLFLERESGFNKGLYSYYGNTLGNAYYYGNVDVNLTLLSPAGGSASNVSLGALAPAAGGDLGALAPAAGGESSAGGADSGCANNYLDDGFNASFNNRSCADNI